MQIVMKAGSENLQFQLVTNFHRVPSVADEQRQVNTSHTTVCGAAPAQCDKTIVRKKSVIHYFLCRKMFEVWP